MTDKVVWHRVAALDELDDGRVMTVTAGRTSRSSGTGSPPSTSSTTAA